MFEGIASLMFEGGAQVQGVTIVPAAVGIKRNERGRILEEACLPVQSTMNGGGLVGRLAVDWLLTILMVG
jgi:hypothetical protein